MRNVVKIIPALLLLDFNMARALTSSQYGLIQESGNLVILLACCILAYSIYSALKGGSLGIPWLIFVVGFSVAAVASVVQLIDSLNLIFGQYDIRLLILILRLGGLLILLIGLIFYRRAVE